MDIDVKQRFMARWDHYFPGAELPMAFYYTGDAPSAPLARPAGRQCFICKLAEVRGGASLAFDVNAVGCGDSEF